MIDVVTKGHYPLTRRERLQEADLNRPSHIRVKASNESIRRYIKHGITRVGFLPDINQSVEWPFDQFTKRRIAKGDVIIDESAAGGAEAAAMFRKRESAQKPTEARAVKRERTSPPST